MKAVRIGIVGAHRGASHNRIFAAHPNCEVVAVCDIREERARALAESLDLQRWHTDLEALLADDAVNAIYIATPDHLHGEMNVRVLRAGKHLLSEIPLATDLDHWPRSERCRNGELSRDRERATDVRMAGRRRTRGSDRWHPCL